MGQTVDLLQAHGDGIEDGDFTAIIVNLYSLFLLVFVVTTAKTDVRAVVVFAHIFIIVGVHHVSLAEIWVIDVIHDVGRLGHY